MDTVQDIHEVVQVVHPALLGKSGMLLSVAPRSKPSVLHSSFARSSRRKNYVVKLPALRVLIFSLAVFAVLAVLAVL